MAEVGRVLSVGDGIARVYGLDEVELGEMVEFERRHARPGPQSRDRQCRRRDLRRRPEHQRRLDRQAHQGDRRRAGRQGLLGRVVDALGDPIDGKGPIASTERRLVDVKAPGIIPRQSVNEPMHDRAQGDRRPDPDRPRPARADHRRPPDRQDVRSRSTASSTRSRQTSCRRRREQEALLHLRRRRPEALLGRSAG